MELAQKAIAHSCDAYGSDLLFLQQSTEEEMRSIPGIGPAKAARLRACAELAKRLLLGTGANGRRYTIRRGKEAFEYIRSATMDLDREHFYILHLNTRAEVTGKEIVSIGSLDATIVHPREIFRTSIKKSAASIILVHNHPSGDPSPSEDDIAITKRLIEAGRLLGIAVADHIIVGRGTYISVRDACPGLFPQRV